MTDILNRVLGDQDPLKKLVSKIPGFTGYINRENRRSADKLLREAIAAQFETIYKKISAIQTDLIANGGIEYLDDVEKAALQIRIFTDRIRNATYGYSGFFDSVKIDENDISAMYSFDLAFVETGEHLSAELDTLAGNIANTEALPAFIRNVTFLARQLNDTFDTRSSILTKPEEAA